MAPSDHDADEAARRGAMGTDEGSASAETHVGDGFASASRSGSRLLEEPERDLFEVGEVLNGVYAVQHVLGRGGMGQVIAAHDRELNRNVAIKACWNWVADDVLEQEAQVMAAFRHPGLTEVYHLGRHNGIRYLVMERLHGKTLADRLLDTQRAFTLAETLALLKGLTAAVAELHRANLVHRDLKPDNIMLVPPHRVVVLDFGIVRQEREVADLNVISGSPQFMAPETIKNEMRVGDAHLIDVYAIGAIAYRLVTGELPFDSPQLTEVLLKHLTAPVPPVAANRPDAPAGLCQLIEEMLAKDPSERPHSIESVRERLARIDVRTAVGRAAKFHVLIAENNPRTLETLSAMVANTAPGARVSIARDGDRVLQLLDTDPPNLVILELDLPKVSDLEVCMSLANVASGGPKVVVVGGALSQPERALFRKFGVSQFVQKDSDYATRVALLVAHAALAVH